MRLRVKGNYVGFNLMARELATVSGKTYAHVIRLEAATCIKIAALKQRIASVAAIKRDVRERKGSKFRGEAGEVSTNRHTATGRVWFTQTVGFRAIRLTGPVQRGKTRHIVQSGGYYMVYEQGHTRGHRLPNAIWAEFLATESGREAFIKAEIVEHTGRRGIERLSWIQMADAISVNLDSVAPARDTNQAVARAAMVRGRQFHNGGALETATGSGFLLVVTNASPAAIKRIGQSRIDDAVGQRVQGFEIACGKGFLDDIQRRSARWPGIFVLAL